MGRRRRKSSVSGYFRDLFTKSPALLNAKTNEEVIARWKADHPGKDFSGKTRQSMANVKSNMRKKGGSSVGGPGARGGRSGGDRSLESLEYLIDDCLAAARRLENPVLEKAIKHLRFARNEVVWNLGQP